MKRLFLLALVLFAPSLVVGQANFGSPFVFPGVPSGLCASNQLAVNSANGNLYSCLNGVWTIVSTSIAPLTIVDANTVAQSNTTTGQTFYIYGTVDNVLSPTNSERLVLQWNSGQSNFRIGPDKTGTGTLRSLDIGPATQIGFLTSGSGRGVITNGSVFTSYNSVGTAGAGLTAIRGTILASTGLVANLGATTILTGGASTAGLYNVCFQASTTTSGTGTTGTVTLSWNDGNAKAFTTGTWALNAVDVTGQVNSCQTIRIAASQNITVATTIGAIGTSVYRADASVVQIQ